LSCLPCSQEDPVSKIGENLRRIFLERGVDFFERYHKGVETPKDEITEEKPENDTDDMHIQPMSPDELFKMRVEIIPQLQ
jgi:mediator of RNA polymerase II transcription subunit 17, fungi type